MTREITTVKMYCDRCKKEIPDRWYMNFITRKLIFRAYSDPDGWDKKYELCDECYAEFKKWIKQGEPE